MDFRLDDSQIGVQETLARFCADRFPLDSIGAREGEALDRVRWRELADLGLFGLLLPDSGFGVLEAAVGFEQLGSHLVPGPLLWTVLAAGLVDGEVVGGTEDDLVEHAADLDVLLVLGADGLTAHRDLPAPTMLDPFDPLTPVGRFEGLGVGEVVARPAAAERLRLLGATLSAASLAGIADRSLTVARDYALEREQFGSPIGSFQAVKHLLADMYLRAGLAQSATYAAAAVLDDPGADDPARAVATAKLVAGEAAVANAATAVQVLGGMGFTWDMLPNFLLKRARVLGLSFGTAGEHALALGAAV